MSDLYSMENNTAYFGGGCFWNAELVYSKVEGVVATEVGWCLFNDDQGQVEVVKVEFDPDKTDLTQLIEPFWSTHNPGNPKNSNSQYVERSMLLPSTDEQEKTMKAALEEKNQKENIYTTISRFSSYKRAPEKDQKYYIKQ